MFRIPDKVPLAITIFWLWVGFIAVTLAAYFLHRWWRRKHPLPPPSPDLSYSARLRERFGDRQRSKHVTRSKRAGK